MSTTSVWPSWVVIDHSMLLRAVRGRLHCLPDLPELLGLARPLDLLDGLRFTGLSLKNLVVMVLDHRRVQLVEET